MSLAATAIFLSFLVILRIYGSKAAVIEGESMSPSFKNHEKVLIQKLGKIKRFDVVVFNPPNGDKEKYVKRVIGLPGEEIAYHSGKLYVNGRMIEDKYSQVTEDFNLTDLKNKKKIPLNNYFVLGDNRKKSMDSRSFGLVNKKRIVGKVSE